ncbi:MAG: carboxymuconolactone decarboxylase family protein [Acidobacteria bacterium]|nr:carboxymuconolactone decarboxylase family protein [Acidobacteriota bacterium]
MQRITAIDPAEATGKAKQLLDGVQAKLGMTPNLMKTLANAPAALEAYLNFGAALGTGRLDAKLREQIALTVAQANACEYCLSAHSAIGKMVGLKPEEIAASREAHSQDAKREAGLQFARAVVEERGEVADAALARVRAAGYTDGEITEIVANVAVNLFTNYFNHVARTGVDFPRVEVGERIKWNVCA